MSANFLCSIFQMWFVGERSVQGNTKVYVLNLSSFEHYFQLGAGKCTFPAAVANDGSICSVLHDPFPDKLSLEIFKSCKFYSDFKMRTNY
jgi:hypothetical protein